MKYYTPDISEFRIGFECEVRQQNEDGYLDDNLFETFICDKDDVLLAYAEYEENPEDYKLNYRVKYLDGEDIKSLGFKGSDSILSYRKDGINLRFLEDSLLIIDHRKKVECVPHLIFKNIKNKSELQQILKMIGV